MRNFTFSNNSLKVPNRFLGGSQQSVHPFVKGYFYVLFEFENSPLFDIYGVKNKNNLKNYILSLAEDFTPPGDRQLLTEDLPGIGGIDASFVVKQQIDRTFSLTFRDLWGSPIFKIHRILTSILDPYWGGALSTKEKSLEFIPNEYKFKAWVVQTRPIAVYASNSTSDKFESNIEKVFVFDGTVPLTDIMSAYNSNIQDNSLIKATIQYRFDGMPIDETYDKNIVKTAAAKFSSLISGAGKTVSYSQ